MIRDRDAYENAIAARRERQRQQDTRTRWAVCVSCGGREPSAFVQKWLGLSFREFTARPESDHDDYQCRACAHHRR